MSIALAVGPQDVSDLTARINMLTNQVNAFVGGTSTIALLTGPQDVGNLLSQLNVLSNAVNALVGQSAAVPLGLGPQDASVLLSRLNTLTTQVNAISLGPAPFHAGAVTVPLGTFVNSDNLITVDSRLGLISVWVPPLTSTGAFLITQNGGFWAVSVTTSGPNCVVSGDFWDTTDSVDFAFNTTFPLAGLSTWINVLMAVDTNHPAGQKIGLITVNRVSQSVTVASDTAPAFDIGWSQDNTSTAIRGNPQDISECYVAMGQFADVSTLTVINKFSDSSGKPISLGSDGSLPTGMAPTMFFSGDATMFGTNKGTGGTFTTTGSPLVNASSSPSD